MPTFLAITALALVTAAPLCRRAPRSVTGVDPYLVCLADGGLPTSGTNPALVGE